MLRLTTIIPLRGSVTGVSHHTWSWLAGSVLSVKRCGTPVSMNVDVPVTLIPAADCCPESRKRPGGTRAITVYAVVDIVIKRRVCLSDILSGDDFRHGGMTVGE